LEPCRLDHGATLAGLRSILSPRLIRALSDTAVARFMEQEYIPQPDSKRRFSPEAVTTLLCLVSSWENGGTLAQPQQRELHGSVQTIMAEVNEQKVKNAPDEEVIADLQAPILLALKNVPAAESLSQLLEGSLSESDNYYLSIKLRHLALRTNRQIARAIGRPEGYVGYYIIKIRAQEVLPSKAALRKRLLAELITTGRTPDEIADALNVEVGYLKVLVNRYNLPKFPRAVNQKLADRDKQVAELLQHGSSKIQIQTKLGISPYKVKKSIKRLHD